MWQRQHQSIVAYGAWHQQQLKTASEEAAARQAWRRRRYRRRRRGVSGENNRQNNDVCSTWRGVGEGVVSEINVAASTKGSAGRYDVLAALARRLRHKLNFAPLPLARHSLQRAACQIVGMRGVRRDGEYPSRIQC